MAEEETTEGAEGSEEETTEGTEEETSGNEPDHKAEAAKWKALARKHEGNAKKNADAAKRLKEIEDKDKSESDRLKEATATERARADAAEAKALRFEVALAKSVPSNLMKFLTGDTQEEIEASADELLAAIGSDKGNGSGTDSGKPKEKLRTGARSSEGDETEMDPAKLAAKIRERSGG